MSDEIQWIQTLYHVHLHLVIFLFHCLETLHVGRETSAFRSFALHSTELVTPHSSGRLVSTLGVLVCSFTVLAIYQRGKAMKCLSFGGEITSHGLAFLSDRIF